MGTLTRSSRSTSLVGVGVSDPDDPRIAAYRSVGDARALERAGVFVAEGRLIVRRVLDDPRLEVASLMATPTALAALADALPPRRAWPIYVCGEPVVRAVTGFNFHRGCLALVRRPAFEATVATLAREPRLLALEGIGNPDNIGGLFRVAAAMGAGGVVLDRTCADPLYRKAIRTSMAATLQVPYLTVRDWPSALQELRSLGHRLIALTPDPTAASIDTLKPLATNPLVLMLGSEGSGLAPSTLASADTRARIPMTGVTDSLNVVVAAAIALHELRR